MQLQPEVRGIRMWPVMNQTAHLNILLTWLPMTLCPDCLSARLLHSLMTVFLVAWSRMTLTNGVSRWRVFCSKGEVCIGLPFVYYSLLFLFYRFIVILLGNVLLQLSDTTVSRNRGKSLLWSTIVPAEIHYSMNFLIDGSHVFSHVIGWNNTHDCLSSRISSY